MVSDQGEIKNIKTGRILKQSPNQHGYSRVSISNGTGKNPTIAFPHRLVAELFIPKEDGKTVVNHKNGIKTDAREDNLEWVTYKENSKHASDTRLIDYVSLSKKATESSLRVTSQPVELHDVTNSEVIYFPSISATARYLGVCNRAITAAIEKGTEVKCFKIVKV